jgi:cytochrome c553
MQGRHLLIGMALAIASASAVALEGDAEAARDKLSMCIGCHGIPGYRTAFPEVYPVPKLGGQHAQYIVRALQAYRDETRRHPSMQAIARDLSDQEMADFAAYYSRPQGGAR